MIRRRTLLGVLGALPLGAVVGTEVATQPPAPLYSPPYFGFERLPYPIERRALQPFSADALVDPDDRYAAVAASRVKRGYEPPALRLLDRGGVFYLDEPT